MAEHECVVGLLNSTQLATVSRIKKHIVDQRNHNQYLREEGIIAPWIYHKVWTMKDYADRRKSTDLIRFGYCPECGEPIDWKAIRRVSDG